MLARPDILRSSAHGGVICTEFTCMLGSRTVEYGQQCPSLHGRSYIPLTSTSCKGFSVWLGSVTIQSSEAASSVASACQLRKGTVPYSIAFTLQRSLPAQQLDSAMNSQPRTGTARGVQLAWRLLSKPFGLLPCNLSTTGWREGNRISATFFLHKNVLQGTSLIQLMGFSCTMPS